MSVHLKPSEFSCAEFYSKYGNDCFKRARPIIEKDLKEGRGIKINTDATTGCHAYKATTYRKINLMDLENLKLVINDKSLLILGAVNVPSETGYDCVDLSQVRVILEKVKPLFHAEITYQEKLEAERLEEIEAEEIAELELLLRKDARLSELKERHPNIGVVV